MQLVKPEGNVRQSDPKHFRSGLPRSMSLCPSAVAGVDNADGCSATATVFPGTCDTGYY